MSVVGVFISELLWTVVTFGCCMIFDMLAMKRSGLAYIAPEGAPTIESRFWVGWSIRHLILIPLSFCLQYVVRQQVAVLSAMWVVAGCLVICYGGFFMRDLFRQIRPKKA
jgi:hypothetical protein